MQKKLRTLAKKAGVKFVDIETVYLSKDTKFGKNVIIEPYVVIGLNVIIGNNVIIKSFSHIEKAIIKNNIEIGPFARIRPDSTIDDNSKIGNFVEVKKSYIGKNSKINHLSYVGDTKIGKKVNLGAGTITCNYDGKKKSKTIIEDNVFVGSNTSLVAPIKIGSNSIIGAGSAITKNVGSNKLSLTRANQKIFKNRK
ncbi:MAG: UDP-N-acetylglucosamine pyrophosphorylase [Candidatus Pelagibacter sp.]|jgi:bifunctional UDP-N-acetylglucosamine pyrophosphorylase/glucosamine-1-phosphate N-acetyltransferase|nr:UDP-N-acetylglucosamine pyrophosphorylase [Candidatus Pelagibacter sp.]OUW11585.1 MAG: UDP-N-acetylglucosamine pyrophosphorylase [Candidatus Pelagibacter sp. TMED166]|tara:strand:+ start:4811 stop:5398 length:588 start_codon:yes stop_codon:yes gene_type:complete